MKNENEVYDLAEFFKVLGDSTRMRILCELLKGEAGVSEIAERLQMTVSAISHQLSILKRSRLTAIRRDGKSRYYSLNDDHVKTIISTGFDHLRHG